MGRPRHARTWKRWVSEGPSARTRRIFMAALVVVAVAIVGFIPWRGLPHGSAGAATPGTQCPGGVSQCVTVSVPCTPGPCLTVTAGPTENVTPGQYVFLDLSNFPAGDTARIAYCPTSSPPTIVSDPQCALGPFLGTSLSPSILPVQADGSVQASFPTESDATGENNAPITAHQLVNTSPPPTPTPFFCDDGPDYCAVEITDDGPGVGLGRGNPDDTSANTVIIPISFAATSNGCPSSDPIVFTDSAFSLQQFIPAAVDSTCADSTGVADVNTATNSDEVVSDFASGGTQIAFTDDPDDPNQVASLQGQSYAYVPIAVSATVVAFLAADAQPAQGVAYPVNAYNLTPNMVAGLISTEYTEPYGSDVLIPPLNCAQIAGCSQSDVGGYDAFDLLNPAPTGLSTPGEFGMSFSTVATGASDEVTDWLCHAPNVPFTVSVPLLDGGTSESAVHSMKSTTTTTFPAPTPVSVTDDNLAATTLTTAPVGGIAWPPVGDSTAPWVFPNCQAYPVLPVLSGAVINQYTPAQTPTAQAINIRKFAYGGGGEPVLLGPVSLAAFGAMDWSDAAYAGLPDASLQNAAGNFVTPSASSVDAALADATTDSDGVLSYNFTNTSDSAAYPMPDVTYALVSTAPQSASADQAEGDLLANLVNYSHSGGSIPLPPGYVPMPDNLYTQAIAEITKIFPAATTAPAAPSKSSPTSKSSHTSSPPSSITGLAVSTPEDVGSTPTGTVPPAGAPKARPAKEHPAPLPPRFDPVLLALLTGKDGLILPGLVGVMLLLLVSGPIVYGAPRLRRRLARTERTKT